MTSTRRSFLKILGLLPFAGAIPASAIGNAASSTVSEAAGNHGPASVAGPGSPTGTASGGSHGANAGTGHGAETGAAAGPGADAKPAHTAEPETASRKFSPNWLLCNVFPVAGFQYYDGPGLLYSLAEGQELELQAEPENPYDKYAVEIHHRGLKLGYVPRSDNKHISRLLRQRALLRAVVKEVNPESPRWSAVKVAIYLHSSRDN